MTTPAAARIGSGPEAPQWAWFVSGSGARGEAAPGSDVETMVVLADAVDEGKHLAQKRGARAGTKSDAAPPKPLTSEEQAKRAEQQQKAREQFDSYVRSTAGVAGTASPADELTRLADLKSKGVIDDAEFERLKAKTIG